MRLLDDPTVKHGFATRAVPPDELGGVVPLSRAPRVGDMVVAEVLKVGKNKTLEVRSGVPMYLFEGDRIVGAFGHRYATDQYEGYVPGEPVEACDLLSAGGVVGKVVSRHTAPRTTATTGWRPPSGPGSCCSAPSSPGRTTPTARPTSWATWWTAPAG